MTKRKDSYDDVRRDVEDEWERWPGRKQPKSDTLNMFDFYNWLAGERPDLARFKETATDECWQRIKSWLIRYEDQAGRSIHHEGPAVD